MTTAPRPLPLRSATGGSNIVRAGAGAVRAATTKNYLVPTLKAMYDDDPLPQILTRGVVTPATLSGSALASFSLADELVGLAPTANASAALIARGMQLTPMRGAVTI